MEHRYRYSEPPGKAVHTPEGRWDLGVPRGGRQRTLRVALTLMANSSAMGRKPVGSWSVVCISSCCRAREQGSSGLRDAAVLLGERAAADRLALPALTGGQMQRRSIKKGPEGGLKAVSQQPAGRPAGDLLGLQLGNPHVV